MSTYRTKGQVGFELLVTIFIILVTLMVFLELNGRYLRDYDESYRYQKLQSSLDDLAVAVNAVYQQGLGATGKSIIELPSGIQSSQVSGTSIVYLLGSKGKNNTFEKTFEFALNGSLPVSAGRYEIVIASKEGLVHLEAS